MISEIRAFLGNNGWPDIVDLFAYGNCFERDEQLSWYSLSNKNWIQKGNCEGSSITMFFFSLSDFSGSYSNKRKGHPNYGLGKEGTLILAVAMPSFSSKNDNADECWESSARLHSLGGQNHWKRDEVNHDWASPSKTTSWWLSLPLWSYFMPQPRWVYAGALISVVNSPSVCQKSSRPYIRTIYWAGYFVDTYPL